VNDDEMRGMLRASETICALEECYSGQRLLDELRASARQAYEVSQHANRQAVRDEWYWRWKAYGAAYRRVNAKERARVA
jgi:hypothetical protein